jgi:predicted HicB family RNase H-like nuclease
MVSSEVTVMARAGDKILNYKNYHGSMEVSVDDSVIHGRILYIQDVITYESPDVAGVNAAFETAVDRYLEFCAEVGDKPEKPFSGSFNIRISQTLHREAVISADNAGISLNRWVEDAIRERLFPTKTKQAWINAFISASTVTQEAEGVWNPISENLKITHTYLRAVK